MEENTSESTISISVKKHVVVYGKHDYILKNVQDLLERSDYSSAGFVLLAEALDYIKMNPLDAIIIGGGVEPHDRTQIKNLVRAEFPHVRVIEHYGGPATIIPELKNALA